MSYFLLVSAATERRCLVVQTPPAHIYSLTNTIFTRCLLSPSLSIIFTGYGAATTAANTMSDPLPTSVPRLKPNGSNWVVFHRFLETYGEDHPVGTVWLETGYGSGKEVGHGIRAVMAAPITCKDYGPARHLCPGVRQARVIARGHSHGQSPRAGPRLLS